MLFDGKYMYKTNVIYTGIKVNRISELDMNKLTCMLDFYLWFRYQGNIDVQDIEFVNAVEPIHLETSQPQGELENVRIDEQRSQGVLEHAKIFRERDLATGHADLGYLHDRLERDAGRGL